MRLLLACVLSWVTFSLSAQSTDTISEYILLDTIQVAANPAQPPYQPSHPLTWRLLHTRVALKFNPLAKTAACNEWLTATPYFYPTDSIVLDAKGMKIDTVLASLGKKNCLLNWHYNNNQLTIRFTRTHTTADTVLLRFVYTAMPYADEVGGSAAISEDRGLYFINTDKQDPLKPTHIWTQGETEANAHWMITIDKPNIRFTTQLELTVPDSLVTLSNGKLINTIKSANGLKTDVWRMDQPIQTYAVMFAVGKYHITRDKWRDKEVNYYVEPQYAASARQMFAHTTDMMEYFSSVTGVPYPWPKYSQVVVRDYVSGAMENTSASLFGEFVNLTTRELRDKNNEDIVAHELFHQWFGDYVTAESWSNLTLNESFANYGEQLWRRHKYGNEFADDLAWKDLQGYISSARFKDPQLVRFYYLDKEKMFDAISYNKGGSILRYMHHIMGNEAFSRAMYHYLSQNVLRSAEAHQWRLAVEEATGLDWNWFFNQWYYQAGHPVLQVKYHYDDSLSRLIVTIKQNQTDSTFLYQLPLHLGVLYSDSIQVVPCTITNRYHRFIYPYRNGIKPVVIPDYYHVFPGEVKETKQPELWYRQYLAAQDYVTKRLAIAGAGKKLSDPFAVRLFRTSLADSSGLIRQYTLRQLEEHLDDNARSAWQDTLLIIARADNNNKVRQAAIDVLATWKLSQALSVFIQAITDSSYAVAGASLSALRSLAPDTAYLLATSLRHASLGGELATQVFTTIAHKADIQDLEWLSAFAARSFGGKRLSCMHALSVYLKKLSTDTAFSQALSVAERLTITETETRSRSAMAGILCQLAPNYQHSPDEDKKEDHPRLGILKNAIQRILIAEQDATVRKKIQAQFDANFQ